MLGRTMKFYEVTTQFVLTSHVVGYDMCAVTTKVWDGLKPEQQRQVHGRRREGVRRVRRQVQCAGEGRHRLLQGGGPQVYTPDVDCLPHLRTEEVPRRPRANGRRACSSASTPSSKRSTGPIWGRNSGHRLRMMAGFHVRPRANLQRNIIRTASAGGATPRRKRCSIAAWLRRHAEHVAGRCWW